MRILFLASLSAAAATMALPPPASACRPSGEAVFLAPQSPTWPANMNYFVQVFASGSRLLEAELYYNDAILPVPLARRQLGPDTVEFYINSPAPDAAWPEQLTVFGPAGPQYFNLTGPQGPFDNALPPAPQVTITYGPRQPDSCDPQTEGLLAVVSGAVAIDYAGYILMESFSDGEVPVRFAAVGGGVTTEIHVPAFPEQFEGERCFFVVTIDNAGNRSPWSDEVACFTNGVKNTGEDGGTPDVLTIDAQTADAQTADAESADAGQAPDAATPLSQNPGGLNGDSVGCGCRSGSLNDMLLWPLAFLALLLWRRRRALALASIVALVFSALPQDAEACSFAPDYFLRSPTVDGPKPGNASFFVEAWMIADSVTSGELHFGDAFAPVPLNMRRLGHHAVEFWLPNGDLEGETPDQLAINGDITGWRYIPLSFTFGAHDTVAPSAPIYQLAAERRSPDSCFYELAMVRVVVEPKPTAEELVGHILQEHVMNDVIPVAFALADTNEFAFLLSPGSFTGERCFTVVAVDAAGNRSPAGQPRCLVLQDQPDAGMDAGFPDSGTPDGPAPDVGQPDSAGPDVSVGPDTGPAPDAGQPSDSGKDDTGRTLTGEDVGCGCRDTAPANSWWWCLVFALAVFKRRAKR